MATQLICARLGVLHDILMTLCVIHAQEPKEILTNLIAQELSRFTESGACVSPRTKNKRIRFAAAGDIQQQLAQYCKLHGVPLNTMLNQLVLHEVIRTLKTASADQLSMTNSKEHEVHVSIGVPDTTRIRLELSMRETVFNTIYHLAKASHTTPQRLIVKIVRAFLMKKPEFGEAEITSLGSINLELKRIGNNLNQIARRINAMNANDEPRNKDAQEVAGSIEKIDAYVQNCAELLQLAREHWRIELRS